MKALRTLCKRKAKDPEEADTLVIKWVHQLLSKASKTLQSDMTKESENNKNNSLFTPPSGTRKGNGSSTTMSRLLAQAATAVYTIGSLVVVCPSADLTTIIPILHNIITSEISDPKQKKSPGVSVSFKQTAPLLYNQAWVTMGKICLADGKLAKRYIPLFVQVSLASSFLDLCFSISCICIILTVQNFSHIYILRTLEVSYLYVIL